MDGKDKDIEHRLTEVESRSKSNTHRIDDMERRQDNLDDLVSTVKVLVHREETVENDVKEIKSDMKILTGKSGKMWESIVEKVVLAIVAAVVGFVLAQIGIG